MLHLNVWMIYRGGRHDAFGIFGAILPENASSCHERSYDRIHSPEPCYATPVPRRFHYILDRCCAWATDDSDPGWDDASLRGGQVLRSFGDGSALAMSAEVAMGGGVVIFILYLSFAILRNKQRWV